MSELTNDEADHVRAALRFLRVRCGGWKPLGKVLHVDPCALRRIADGRTVTASIAFRVARLAGVGVDDVLTGRYPVRGACPHCGHVPAPVATLPSGDAGPALIG